MSEFCLRNVTVSWQKTAEKQVISGGSIIRCVRKTLSFSKKIENHIGAVLLFVKHYNDTIKKEITDTI